jgi:hypothetical protein
MTNDLIKKYTGKHCAISTGAFGNSVAGTIISVEDNWVEVSTKKGSRLVNADYITDIAEIPAK